MNELLPHPTTQFRRRAWLEFPRTLDPLPPPNRPNREALKERGRNLAPAERQKMIRESRERYGFAGTNHSDWEKRREGSTGLRDIRTTDRNGPVVGVTSVRENDDIMLITSQGMVNRTHADEIRITGRNAQGVRLNLGFLTLTITGDREPWGGGGRGRY